jgi:TRAP-type C4-dicarboxylate transport system permease small subunit
MGDASAAGRAGVSIDRITSAIFSASAIVLLPLITLLITADAFLRYVFNAPISWAQDLAGLFLFVLFCGGLTHSMAQNVHVRMDLVYDMLPARVRRLVDIASGGFAVLFSGMLAYQAIPSTLTAWRNNSMMPTGEIVIWPFAAVGSACLLLFGIAVILSVILGRGGQQP